ncbi:MAG: hypothetical protein RI842_10965 [Schleiferiaceae bacterium]|nr:hypothetical protein [Schleiferiaceae bacterium]
MQARSAAEMPTEEVTSVLRALIYFDLFDHPLGKEELQRFASWQEPGLLDVLERRGWISSQAGYFSLPGRGYLIAERLREAERVRVSRQRARLMARLIACFPFVRGVGLSGSLSKQRMEKGGDLDFFVVTGPGRLWIARTLLMLFKKVWLLNSHKYFCLNYFVDEQHLSMPEQNRYIATELVSLIPLYGATLYEELLRANQWTTQYLGPLPPPDRSLQLRPRRLPLKKFWETMLNLLGGERLDHFLCWQTWRYRRQKFAAMPTAEFKEAFDTSRTRSRHHPRNFNARVEAQFRKACTHYEQQWGLILREENS